MRSRVLFISGRPSDARVLSRMLHQLPLAIDYVPNLEIARTKLNQQEYDVVLTEAALPDGKWLDVLHLVRECPQDPEVIVTDPVADAQFWAHAPCAFGPGSEPARRARARIRHVLVARLQH